MDEILRVILLIGLCVSGFIVIAAVFENRRKAKEAARRRAVGSFAPPPVPPRRAVDLPTAMRAAIEEAAVAAASQPKVEQRPLSLDIGAFKPVSDAEAKQLAGAVGPLWTNPWFGRRDLIPPASDPRTNLIDRGMVGHGFITPEELVEIHQIGQQMDAVRPDLAQARVLADEAVRNDREARARLKREKQAAAAERKRLHKEAVARRKATDIIHLGRGVSKGLADRTSKIEKLQQLGLPVLSTPAEVAAALGLSIPRLRWLAYHSDASGVNHYVRFPVPKRSGGVRMLAAPHEQLARAQEWILTSVLEKVAVHPAAHGFVPRRSTVTNAAPHVGRALVVNTDLTDFFPTITFHRVAGLFRMLGYSPAVATIFALLCTDAPRREVTYAGRKFYVATAPRALPQGACTSPALSNLAARRLDSRLSGIATKLGWRYTRYADDLSFSCDVSGAPQIGYLLARVRHIAVDEGFAVNEAKTRVLRESTRQLVTGVVVNDRPGVPRATVRRLRAILHRAKFEGIAAQNREKLPHFEMWLRGMIAYVHMVNPEQAKPLYEALNQVAGR